MYRREIGQLRLRSYDRSSGPLVEPSSPIEYPFTTGIPYNFVKKAA